ncbi:uncharacterized protein METZ01_LOCUS471581, partial [marine metagenome]
MSGKINSAGAKSGIIGTTELDYEEGTWTPSVVGGSLTISSTYRAIYIKVGNIIHIQSYMVFNSNGAGTGL